MNFSDERKFRRWFLVFSSIAIIILIVWNTVIFFQRLKEDERRNMNVWAAAQVSLDQADENTDLDLTLSIINNNTSIPTIWVDEKDQIVDVLNVPDEIISEERKLQNYLQEIKGENEPIEMDLGPGKVHHIYYGNSPLLNKLKYYPLVLMLIILLFIAVIYFFYTTTKSSEQNKLWAGMAKETAHQIGTPLSSLIGWIELLKQENVSKSYLSEMQKDVDRLRTITERFSKIGSAPTLKPANIVEQTRVSFDYLKSRSSKLINFSVDLPDQVIYVDLNKQLYSWTIENLVKNAIDAMRGKGDLYIRIREEPKCVHIFIQDSGKGIPRDKFRQIFEPGYTTKKRGWGLGLSLSKRIIEQYHKGKIKVSHSEINKGTTFQITLPKLKKVA
ncbi:sensor histidine kinase [Salinimicrobium sp. GXAS 041]|uniref:sensor histidine kinase n=1 Tax=Salinimicrobium sp. GXAS 041 TaxID=3400806 RepID=UPI003C79679C